MKILTSLVALLFVTNAALASEARVSIEVGEPGFYGRIDVGNAPRPLLIYREPILVVRAERAYPPIYMRVPPGHAKHWRKHCGEYRACGRPVYFVQDGWYNDVYVPHYRKEHGRGRGKEKS